LSRPIVKDNLKDSASGHIAVAKTTKTAGSTNKYLRVLSRIEGEGSFHYPFLAY
jgi:hypothetical protein